MLVWHPTDLGWFGTETRSKATSSLWWSQMTTMFVWSQNLTKLYFRVMLIASGCNVKLNLRFSTLFLQWLTWGMLFLIDDWIEKLIVIFTKMLSVSNQGAQSPREPGIVRESSKTRLFSQSAFDYNFANTIFIIRQTFFKIKIFNTSWSCLIT